jgi:excisionase family DNA binding protein
MTTTTTTALDEPQLLTANEYAAQYRVTPRSVYRWVASGQLDAVRIGRVVRVVAGAVPARNTPAP